MPGLKYSAYEAAKPYFDLVRGTLGDMVDGEHFFDIVTDDVGLRCSLRLSRLASHLSKDAPI